MVLNIRELNLDIITPNKLTPVSEGGHKIVVIGAPKSGKTTLVTRLIYEKSSIIPTGIVFSGTEDSNHHYKNIIPTTFVYNGFDRDVLKRFISRQKIAREYLPNPWSLILLDDCTDDTTIFNDKLMVGMYKNGRHYAMLYILSLQYSMDVKPVIRTNISGVFIFREPNIKNRKRLWENYAGIIPDFQLFCDIMDSVCNNYTALYIDNTAQTNNWQDCVFWYRAKPVPNDFKFGCDEMWSFHNARYNPNYKEDYDL